MLRRRHRGGAPARLDRRLRDRLVLSRDAVAARSASSVARRPMRRRRCEIAGRARLAGRAARCPRRSWCSRSSKPASRRGAGGARRTWPQRAARDTRPTPTASGRRAACCGPPRGASRRRSRTCWPRAAPTPSRAPAVTRSTSGTPTPRSCSRGSASRERAIELAREELELSHAFGAARAMRRLDACAGPVRGRASGLGAAAALGRPPRGSGARLDHAKSLVELGCRAAPRPGTAATPAGR